MTIYRFEPKDSRGFKGFYEPETRRAIFKSGDTLCTLNTGIQRPQEIHKDFKKMHNKKKSKVFYEFESSKMSKREFNRIHDAVSLSDARREDYFLALRKVEGMYMSRFRSHLEGII